MDLNSYEALKSALADVLRSVPWRAADALRNRDLFDRLAEDRFNVVVVGGYSRGKSTLMNAMLGVDRLPTGVEPLTSVITSVTYNTDERVTLHFSDSSLFLDVRLDQLADYVTERGNPGNRRHIREAEIQLPAELLRRGFRFIDTPGLGSPQLENTRTTEAFLAEADAFVLVSGVGPAFVAEDAALVEAALRAGRRIFVVLNKMDDVQEPDRERLLSEARDRFRALGLEEPPFPVSAQDGLRARLSGDSDLLRRSGLAEFEAALVGFLLTEKRHAFIAGMCDRIGATLQDDASGGRDELQWIRDQSARLRDEPEPEGISIPVGAATPFRPCEICERVEYDVFDLLTKLQAELRESAERRAAFVRDGGLCALHGRELARFTAPREVCTALAPVLFERAARLRALADQGADGALDAALLLECLPGRQGCPACRLRSKTDDKTRRGIMAQLEGGTREVTDLSALCIPHGLSLAHAATDPELRSRIMRHLASNAERMAEDMRRFATKQDASRRDRMSKEERAAWSRGLELLSGKDNASIELDDA